MLSWEPIGTLPGPSGAPLLIGASEGRRCRDDIFGVVCYLHSPSGGLLPSLSYSAGSARAEIFPPALFHLSVLDAYYL